MKLTKEQKEELARELSTPWGHVRLNCDGTRVSLAVERYKGLSYRVMTYVEGFFKGEWMFVKSGASPAPEAKFLRKSVRPNVSPAKRAKLEKALGKRYVQTDAYFGGVQTVFLPDWSSGKAAINHLCKVCESVEIVEKSEAGRLGVVGAAIADVLG